MKSEHKHISLTKEQMTMLRESAKADNRSMNAYIGILIEKDYRHTKAYREYLENPDLNDPRN